MANIGDDDGDTDEGGNGCFFRNDHPYAHTRTHAHESTKNTINRKESVRVLVRWAKGKRLTNRLPNLSLITKDRAEGAAYARHEKRRIQDSYSLPGSICGRSKILFVRRSVPILQESTSDKTF